MRVVLVGADFEENLGVGMIAAVARRAGHDVTIVPFNHPDQVHEVARDVLASEPDAVGLSIQFQHRSSEFLALSRLLRKRGFEGHITAGGQFPTLAWRDALDPRHGLSSIVLHEGEESFPELLAAMEQGRPLAGVAGLAIRTDDGLPVRTAGRRLNDDLDAYPFPARYRPHGKHYGVPFIPIMGGRGCWGSCAYCSITSTLRDARNYGGGKTLRHRSPDDVAREMAELSRKSGGRAIFCFHDDNFLMPRPKDSLARVRAIRERFDALGGGEAALIGKCRPDSVTPELMRELRALGVIRLYVGVENASQRGADHLGRKTQQAYVDEALKACREAGIFVCYNLLIFEPDATLADLRENVAFMRRNAHHPVNFCRAEPYVGTPLHADVAARQDLGGSYLGFNYRIDDDDTELVFRVCSAAFRQRNFDADGVANRNMGLGYSLKILEHFYEDPGGERAELSRRTDRLTKAISLETASFLDQAIDLAVAHRGDPDAVARHTALLGLEIAAADRERQAELDLLYRDMNRFGERAANRKWWKTGARKIVKVAQSLALTTSIAAGAFGCDDPPPPDPVPPDQPEIVPHPPPPDPLPPDQPQIPNDPVPNDPVPVDYAPPPPDPPPPDRPEVLPPVDPPPPDLRPERPPPPPPPPPDPVPRDIQRGDLPVHDPLPSPGEKSGKSLALIDQWRETAVQDVMRTTDLPLFDPPRVRLRATWKDGAVEARLEGVPDAGATLRWQAEGPIEGEGEVVRWSPAAADDQLRVAIRTKGGVAITSVRASQLR